MKERLLDVGWAQSCDQNINLEEVILYVHLDF